MNIYKNVSRSRRWRLSLIPLVALCLAGAATSRGQYVTTIASFNGTDGEEPLAGLTLSSDGSTFYGTTFEGGNNPDSNGGGGGTVFSVPVSGGTPTDLYSFIGGNVISAPYGEGPSGTLTLIGSTLYGTAEFGGDAPGSEGGGTVFSLSVSGGTPTVLAAFSGAGNSPQSLGAKPLAGVTLSSDGSTLYGTTLQGNASGESYGTVFAVPLTGGGETIANLDNTNTGEGPKGTLTLSSDGTTLYGTAANGGSNNDGTVFSVPVGGGTPTPVGTFDGSNGEDPIGKLTLIGTTLYGTTRGGGPEGGVGTVFSVPAAGGSITTLATFSESAGSIYDPSGGLTLSSDGKTLYGTAELGGLDGTGAVFSVPVDSTDPTAAPTIVASFDDGGEPLGDLTLIGNTLYGTSEEGGQDGDGSVFAVVVPEPGSAALLLAGLAAVGLRRRRTAG